MGKYIRKFRRLAIAVGMLAAVTGFTYAEEEAGYPVLNFTGVCHSGTCCTLGGLCFQGCTCEHGVAEGYFLYSTIWCRGIVP